MDQIVRIAEEQQVDIVIVAGDLFDSFNPGTEAIELFYRTLKRLANNGQRPVIAISGNHDSPALIDAPDPLARECGIILIGHPRALVKPLTLDGFAIRETAEGFMELQLRRYPYPIRILHTAYANEIRLKQYLGEDKGTALNQVLAAHWQEIADGHCDDQGVNILTTHLYMNKRGEALIEEPDGEKPIKIGNADLIFSDSIPPQIQYTALGHIHRAFNIGTAEKPIVYSSSPICYSFSEAGQTKYVHIVDATPGENVQTNRIALQSGRPLYRKTFQTVDDAVTWLEENPNSLVELTIQLDSYLKAEERNRLYKAHDGIIHLIPVIKNIGQTNIEHNEIQINQDIRSLFRDYFKSQNNQLEPNEEVMDLFNEILNDEQ
jgi:exonuclease SbcD